MGLGRLSLAGTRGVGLHVASVTAGRRHRRVRAHTHTRTHFLFKAPSPGQGLHTHGTAFLRGPFGYAARRERELISGRELGKTWV